MKREGQKERKSTETQVKVNINIDGRGESHIDTKVPFLDHMLCLFARHGFFDLSVEATGDVEVDYHHIVEDIGIVLGDALKDALGEKKGIRRYGSSQIPMDEALASVAIDISGRPYLIYNIKFPAKGRIREFDVDLIEDFFRAFTNHALLTIHINIPYGRNIHHIFEALFKAFARALDEATSIDARRVDIPSTKGML